MKVRHATTGATLILVVLFTLLLLTVVLAATMRLGLASRQNTGDQKAILQAQYAAESNLSLIRSRLQDMQTLLSNKSIKIPTATSISDLNTWVLKFCGSSTWSSTTTIDYTVARDPNDKTLYANAKQCNYTASSSSDQFALLSNSVDSSKFALLPSIERPAAGASLDAWWKSKLGTQLSMGAGSYQLNPIMAVKLDTSTYRFYFSVNPVMASSSAGGQTNRTLRGQSATDGVWWFQVELPNLLRNVLMTNHHRTKPSTYTAGSPEPDVFFLGDQTFDGDVTTNEQFLFNDSSAAKFYGNVYSAGCQNLPLAGAVQSGGKDVDCTHQAGVWTGTDSAKINGTISQTTWSTEKPLTPLSVDNTKTANTDLKAKVMSFTSNKVQFNGGNPEFVADFKALPTNPTDQQKMADGQLPDVDGIGFNFVTLSSGAKNASNNTVTPDGLKIFAGDKDGNSFTNSSKYVNGKWQEPSPTYQYISMLSGTTEVVNRRYRIDSAGSIEWYDSSKKNWILSTSPAGQFNGMIYSGSTSAINLYGPSRLNSDTTGALQYAPPALASFMNMTVTAKGSINLKTDLTMSDTPCDNSSVLNKTCTKSDVKNTLGLFSSDADISIEDEAPNNVNFHAALMSSKGEIRVKSYNNKTMGDRGTVNITGSVIENFYGAFGQSGTDCNWWDGCTPYKAGFSRNFHWDPRFDQGVTPRGFPVSPTWVTTDASSLNVKRSLTSLIFKQGSRE